MHSPIEGVSIGQHPMVSLLLKEVFQSRPQLPKYSETWHVEKVAYLDSQKVDINLPLKALTLRTTMLIALS
jgi:hypothetical protein